MNIHPFFKNYTPGGHRLNPALLWDYDFKSIDFKKTRRLVVTRILQMGEMEDWMFGFDTYGPDGMAESVKNEVTDLLPKDLNFACIMFGLKKEDTKCYKHRQSREKLFNL